MKETGLMFKAPLVRAVLEGRKTQTRRIVKPQPAPDKRFQGWILDSTDRKRIGKASWGRGTGGLVSDIECIGSPCGKPGDRIYVRETFVQGYKADPETGAVRDYDEEGNDIPMTTWYRATDGGITWGDDDGWETNVPWKPAIHMPKALARIWLEITGVRVERLQEITPEDCIAEGLNTTLRERDAEVNLKQQFKELWESTGGDWAANPWVWVVDFKVLSTTGRPA